MATPFKSLNLEQVLVLDNMMNVEHQFAYLANIIETLKLISHIYKGLEGCHISTIARFRVYGLFKTGYLAYNNPAGYLVSSRINNEYSDE